MADSTSKYRELAVKVQAKPGKRDAIPILRDSPFSVESVSDLVSV